jgi:pSer/pThr/pTyr-binding forkhead associated (FHA) protein
MPITVCVRSEGTSEARLRFDGLQPVLIGRGASCDVRLPDLSVSHRHACLRANGVEFVLIDEGSTNGTFVGHVRVAPRTSRIVRSGDMVRVGRIWLELRIEPGPVTRDVAAATRDLALAMVSRALAAGGGDVSARIRVVEGPDQGSCLALEDRHSYLVGRDATCDLAISDANASRVHARIERRGNVVVVRDLGGKNGTWLGDVPATGSVDIVWRPTQMMRMGNTVLALEEPLSDLLASVERAPDEPLPVGDFPSPPERGAAAIEPPPAASPVNDAPPPKPPRARFSVADLLVMTTALGVLALSVAAIIWLLRS